MCVGTRYYWIVVHAILLIVVGVQGIAPDAQDLASFRALHLLFQHPIESHREADDSGSSNGQICRLVENEFETDLEEIVARSPQSEFVSNWRRKRLSGSSLACLPSIQNDGARGDLLSSLCRRIC